MSLYIPDGGTVKYVITRTGTSARGIAIDWIDADAMYGAREFGVHVEVRDDGTVEVED